MRVIRLVLVAMGLFCGFAFGGSGITVTDIGNFGPTGLEIRVRPDRLVEITGVQEGSPAEGEFSSGQIISTINGFEIPDDGLGPQVHLARRITEAEATDGMLRFEVHESNGAEPKLVQIQIPVMGAFSPTWPVDCAKTDRIIREKADGIGRLVETSRDGLTSHNLNNALAILFLLSTGEEQDLDVVRGIYARRMADFDADYTGPHSWHNGYQGIAATEYYLRTGDETAMPLINAIAESARRFQVHGGWTHWARGVNPQYVAGGLMNPAGTQILTSLLLANMAGAEVDQETMLNALTYFYRFAGRGSNPYGDHRPESGYGSNNGKSEMLAIAMHVASLATEGGEIYAMACDKNAQTPLYSTRHMLMGHTGGGLGAIWHGIAASHMMDQRSELYRHRKDSIQWFYELSRRHDGLFGITGGERYDQISYGHGMGLALTAPRRTLQITGAPRSPYAKDFSLPERLWGREADLTFFDIEGGEKYGARTLLPQAERESISKADEAGLERLAYHPEHVYREWTAGAIRDGQHFGLIERLLRSDDPRARQTAAMSINDFEPWNMRSSRHIQSRLGIHRNDFTQEMFDALLDMITNPAEALWNVNHALLALPAASAEQVISRLDDILPWLEHEEWWLQEASVIAMAPAMADEAAMERIVPAVMAVLSNMEHARPRGTISWFFDRATRQASWEIRESVAIGFLHAYQQFPSVPDPEEGVDHSGITSMALYGILNDVLQGTDETILAGARASVARIEDMRRRELDLAIDSLIAAGEGLAGSARSEIGKILRQYYRAAVVGDDPETLRERIESGREVNTMNKLLQIDQMAGLPVGWQLLGNHEDGTQVWWVASYEPADRLPDNVMERYRSVDLPAHLQGWNQFDYDPAAHGWIRKTEAIGETAPLRYDQSERWTDELLPDAGEVLLVRKSFELEDLDAVMYRVIAYTRQGFEIYLNGHRISEVRGRSRTWQPRITNFNDAMKAHLREGTNVLAARSFLQYFRGKEGNMTIYIEALPAFPEIP